ncbi:MAG: hypothetical protein KAJ03_00450, partial [Gammaproteobacteria bacterium]|nr:hypothetical protein [Gammaproteobacteria bacterium]
MSSIQNLLNLLWDKFNSVVDVNDLTVRTEGYYPLIAQGKIADHVTFDKIAKSANVSATEFAIVSNIPVVHPGGVQMTFVSDSTDDDVAGIGV